MSEAEANHIGNMPGATLRAILRQIGIGPGIFVKKTILKVRHSAHMLALTVAVGWIRFRFEHDYFLFRKLKQRVSAQEPK